MTKSKKHAIVWLLGHMTKVPYIATLFLTSVVASVLLQTLSSVYLGNVFETLESGAGRTPFIHAVLWVLLLLSGGALMQWMNSFSILILRLKVEKAIRNEIYVAFLNKKQDFLNTARTGDLLSIGTNELRSVSVMFQPGISMTLRGLLFYLIPLTVIVSHYSWTMWLLPLTATVVLIPLMIRYARNITDTTREVRVQFGRLNADLNESIEGIEVIKTNNQERQEITKFAQNVQEYTNRNWARALVEIKYVPTLLFHLFFTTAFLHCLFQFHSGTLTLGQIITYMSLFTAIGSSIGNAEITFGFIGMGLASAVRILESIRNGADETEKPAASCHSIVNGGITFKNISYALTSGRKLLNNISLSIQPGEKIAIVGATGSGKSLLTQLINRSLEPTEGTVEIDGIAIDQWDLNVLRSRIAIVEQDVFLFSWSVRDNIAFANMEMTDEEVRHCASLVSADGFIQRLEKGYETRVGERGVQLSGGQRQRIAMARALASKPRILVMDDSTSGLDAGTEQEIVTTIQQMSANITVLLVTNRLPLIEQAERIILLNQGEIGAQGKHEELLVSSSLYRDLFSQKEVIGHE